MEVGGRHLELQMYFYYTSRGAHIYLAPGDNTPCSATVYMTLGKEGNVLFNDALKTFYLRLYGVRHMVKDHSDSEKGNPLPPHRLLFPISSKGSFICTIPQTR